MENMDEKKARPSHHLGNGVFANPKKWGEKVSAKMSFSAMIEFMKCRWELGKVKIPKKGEIPIEKPSFLSLCEKQKEEVKNSKIACTWIGHSSCYVQVEFPGKTIHFLTDPMFSQRASMFQWAGPKRYVDPPFEIKDLPSVDFVLISHNHYDHLDYTSVQRIIELFDPTFYVPLRLKKWFKTCFEKVKVVELDWWEDCDYLEGVKIKCFPCQHFSARGVFDRDKTLWCSWGVECKEGEKTAKVFFAGDTGYNEVCFKEIGKKFGPVDVGLIPIGAYIPRGFMKPVHVNPHESCKIAQDINCKKSIGIHWGTFSLTLEQVMDPVKDLEKEVAILQKEDEFKMLADELGNPTVGSPYDGDWFIALKHGETKVYDI